MPSNVVTATNVNPVSTPPGALIATEIRNSVFKVDSLTVDNKGSALDHSIEVWDSFLPDKSHAVDSPSYTKIRRHRVEVLAGDVVTLEKEDLAGVRCLGNLSVLADAIDASCYITVGYEID